jgi:hypothetical protein
MILQELHSNLYRRRRGAEGYRREGYTVTEKRKKRVTRLQSLY